MHFTVVTLATRWQRSPEWVRRAANAGTIPGTKIGGLWRFDPADIEAYENRHKTADPMSMTDRAIRRRSA